MNHKNSIDITVMNHKRNIDIRVMKNNLNREKQLFMIIIIVDTNSYL